MLFLLGIGSVLAQNLMVSGKITDETGTPLPGVSVVVKGSSRGVASDFDGLYSIEAKSGDILEFSSVGFKSHSQKISTTGGKSLTINVLLKEEAEELETVVVVGYGVQKKESVTGSLQTLKSEKLKDVTTPSVANLLNGKVSGVHVTPSSGRPGGTANIVIRGKSTINGATSPLWVIDGVIVGTSPGSLNPSDIETMTILKDAASTAIYGSEGANGVILITTKSAKTGKMETNFSFKQGITQLNWGNMQMMNGQELYDYFKSFSNEASISFPRWNPELRNSNFDWKKEATRVGFIRDYTASISGGGENLKSYLSLGYYDESGTVKGYDYAKHDFRFKTDYLPYKWLTIKPSISGSIEKAENREHSTSAIYANLPWDSPYDTEGKIVPPRSPLWVNSTWTNYLYDLQWNHGQGTTYRFLGNFDFNINIAKGLTFSSINNFNWVGGRSQSYTDPRSSVGEGVKGRISESQSNYIQRYTAQNLQYSNTFDSHTLSGQVIYEYRDWWSKSIGAQGIGFIQGFENLNTTSKPEAVSGTITEWAKQSFISKIAYQYDSRYMAEAHFRRDGASNFGENAKYGNFYSFSAGWNIHNEKWYNIDWLDQFKLRASYGKTGIIPNQLYAHYDLYNAGVTYQENSGLLITQIGNKNLTWESVNNKEIGVDFSFFKRVSLSLNYYTKYNENTLNAVPITGLTGVTSVWRNVGEISNQGFETTVGVDIIKKEDFHWNIDLNIGTNKNRVEKLYKGRDEIILGPGIAGAANKILKPGLDSDSYYMQEWAGVDPENGQPLWYKTVTDADGNEVREKTNKYAEANQVVVGSSTPDFFGGFGTSLVYKDFDFSASFGFSYGGKLYNYARQEYDSDGAYSDRNQMRLIKGWNRWEKVGDHATHPVAAYNNPSNSNKLSSRYLEDGSYLKLRSLSVGYNLDLAQYNFPKVRLYITGENLYTFTNYSGVDPESQTSSGSISPSVYPSTRKIMFGVNFKF